MLYCILQLLYILSIYYECLGKGRRLERERARGDVRGPEEQGAGTVEMLFLDVVISVCHQFVGLSVPGQQSKVTRGCPSLWKEGSAERRAVKSIALCKLTCLIISKTGKSVHGNTLPCKDDNTHNDHLLGGPVFRAL